MTREHDETLWIPALDELGEEFMRVARTEARSGIRPERAFPGCRSKARVGALALTSAVAVALAATPAVGVGERVVDLGTGLAEEIFGGEDGKELREHYREDREAGVALPRYVTLTGLEEDPGTPDRIVGRVWSDRVGSLEVRFTDGGTSSFEPDDRGFFEYEFPEGRFAIELVVKDDGGAILEHIPAP